jgi:hypothetical protein
MIGCWCDETFVEKIDRARRALTRSQFCRDAIAEKLRSMGVDVPDREVAHPDRAGKGGPKQTRYHIPRSKIALNETSPSPAKAAKKKKK